MFAQLRKTFADFIAPELKTRRNELERQANLDTLTGLPNFRAFELARAAAELDQNLCFVSFDLNFFKLVNDHLGHSAGNEVLISFAHDLTQNAELYSYNRVFRTGGDEFVAIMEKRFAEPFRDAVEGGYIPAEHIRVTASGTIGNTFEEADLKLKARKDARKGLR